MRQWGDQGRPLDSRHLRGQMTCPKCAGPMELDISFEVDAEHYKVNRRQWKGHCGHRLTVDCGRGYREERVAWHEPRRCVHCKRMIEHVTRATQSLHPECRPDQVARLRKAVWIKAPPRPCESCGKRFRPRPGPQAHRS